MARRNSHRPQQQVRSRAALRLELLEDRTLPALITVNTALDVVDAQDGLTSLREAVTLANSQAGADEIRFEVPTGSIIALTQGQLVVTDTLTITGLGRHDLTLDAGGLSRHFEVATEKTLTLNDIKITGGSADRGGAIKGNTKATIVLNRVEMVSNVATLQGGAIAVPGGIQITDSRFANNSTTSTASNSSGGAIIADIANVNPKPTSTITNSVFEDNVAGYSGGAITFAGGTLVSTDTDYLNNRATNNANLNGGYGGAIHFGGDFTYGTTVNIIGGTFQGNVSNNGGAIRGYRAQLHIRDADFYDNRALDGPSAGWAGFGGAINHSAAYLSVGSFSINTSTFRNNQAAQNGGALFIGGPLGTIRNSTISGNTAGAGAGVFTATGSSSGIITTVTLDHVTITDNTVNRAGGGGGLYASDNTTVHNSIIAGNNWTANVSPANRGDLLGPVTSGSSYNLVGIHIGTASPLANGVNGNQVGVTAPGLAPLGDNGGVTRTHALLRGSPAINAANPGSTVTTDQRGSNRPTGLADIGAFEYVSAYDATFSVADAEGNEGDESNTGQVVFTVTLSQTVAEPVTVRVDTADGTALAGVDYTPISNLVLTFLPGESLSQIVAVPILGNSEIDDDRAFLLQLSNPRVDGQLDPGVTIATPSATGTIRNDDFDPFQPLTEEFRVDPFPATRFQMAAVAGDAHGNSIVVWYSASDNGPQMLYGRRYDRQGLPIGEMFPINRNTTYKQGTLLSHDVAMSADGSFVVVWGGSPIGGTEPGYRVYGQRFSANGEVIGDEFLIAPHPSGLPEMNPAARVAADAQGNFLVVWREYTHDGVSASPILLGRRYDSQGNLLLDTFQVTPSVGQLSDQFFGVDMGPNGHAVVVWSRSNSDGSDAEIAARIYAPAGFPLGLPLQVNADQNGKQITPVVAVGMDGNFVVAWAREYRDAQGTVTGHNIFARRFQADGTPHGDEFQVNTYSSDSQYQPSVAMDADGDFVIAWSSNRQLNAYQEVYLQRYLADGTVLGAETRVNQFIGNSQQRPVLTMDPAGNLFVVWSDNRHTGNAWYTIYARVYQNADGNPADNLGPTVVDVTLDESRTLLTLTFSREVAESAGELSHYTLRQGGVNVSSRLEFGGAYLQTVQLSLREPLPAGTYSLTIGDGVVDLSGNALDGNRDGQPGGEYVHTFRVEGSFLSGNAFAVNTTAAGTATDPVIASNAAGLRVVVWRVSGKGTGDGIFARVYGANGQAVGNPIRVSTTAGINPAVAVDAAGRWVVAWEQATHIYHRMFTAQGTALFNAQTIATGTSTNALRNPAVAFNPDGSYLIAWQGNGTQTDVYARRVLASGVASGAAFRVNSSLVGNQSTPAVSAHPDGRYLVVWQGNQFGDSTFREGNVGLYGQWYSGAGVKEGGEFRINEASNRAPRSPSVAINAAGQTLVTWIEPVSGRSTLSARLLDALGSPVGETLSIDTNNDQTVIASAVASDSTGQFLIGWNWRFTSTATNTPRSGIDVRRFDPAIGTLDSGLTLSGTTSDLNRTALGIAFDRRDAAWVVWQEAAAQNVLARAVHTPRTVPIATPHALDVRVTLDEDSSLTLGRTLFRDAFHDSILQVLTGVRVDSPLVALRIDTLPRQGTLTLNGQSVTVGQVIPASSLDALVYTPRADYHGNDLFRWSGQGALGYASSSQVELVVRPVQDAPRIYLTHPVFTVEEDGLGPTASYSRSFVVFDPDGDALTVSIGTQPAHGTASILAGEANSGQPGYHYMPGLDFVGTDTFTVVATDTAGNSSAQVVTVMVENVPDMPTVLGPKNLYQSPGQSASGVVQAMDVDGEAVTLELLQGPATGTLTFDAVTGAFTFIPSAQTSGQESFIVQAFDGTFYSAPFTVAILYTDVNQVAGAFNAGASKLPNLITTMLTSFDVPAEVDTSFVVANFSSLLNLESLQGQLLSAIPTLDVSAGPTRWLEQLRGSGLEILGFLDGEDTTPAARSGTLGEFRLQREFNLRSDELFGSSFFDFNTLGDQSGLPAGLDVLGNLSGSIQLKVDITFGIDLDGFYLKHDSRMVLDVLATGDLSGSGQVAGEGQSTLSGWANVDFTISNRVDSPIIPARLDGQGDYPWLKTNIGGEATTSLTATFPALDLNWSIHTQVDTTEDGYASDTNSYLVGTLKLPGLYQLDGEARIPAELQLYGSFVDGAWELAAFVSSSAQLEWFDFAIEDFYFRLDLRDGEYSGWGTARLLADFGTSDIPVSVDLDISFDRKHLRATGTTTLLDQQIGDSPTLFTIDRAVLTADFFRDFTGVEPSYSVLRVRADEVVVLPDGNSSGAAIARNLSGSLGGSGRLRLHTGQVTTNLGSMMQIEANGLSIDLAPNQANIATIARLTNAEIRFEGLPNLSTTLNEISIARNGRLAIDNLVVTSPSPVHLGPALAPVAHLTGFRLQGSNLVYDPATSRVGGILTIHATSATALPGLLGQGVLTLENLSGELNLDEESYRLDVGLATARLGGGLRVSGTATQLHWARNGSSDAPLLTAQLAVAELRALAVGDDVPAVEFVDFGMLRNGKFFADEVRVLFPEEYDGTLGMSGLLPFVFDRDGIVIDFPDKFDLDEALISVTGRFQFDHFAANLPFTPRLFLGNDEATSNQSFTFQLLAESLSSGEVKFINVPSITLRMEDLTVADSLLEGQIRFGAINHLGQLQHLPGTSVEIDGYIDVIESDLLSPSARVDLTGDLRDELGVVTVADLAGTAVLSENAGARFSLKLNAVRNGASFEELSVEAAFIDVTLTDLNFDFSPFLNIKVGSLSLASGQSGPNALAHDVVIEFLHAPGLAPATIATMALYTRTGGGWDFDIPHAVLPLDGFFGQSVESKILDLEGAKLELIGLTNRNPQGKLTGQIKLTAVEATFLPGESSLLTGEISSVEDKVPGLVGSYDIDKGIWTLKADTFNLDVGNAVAFIAQDVEFVLDPDKPADPLVVIDSAYAFSPDFPQLAQASVNELKLYRHGFSVTDVTISAGLGEKAVYGDLLEVTSARVDAKNLSYFRGQSWTGEITLAALSGSVLPNLTGFTATIEPSGFDFHGLTGRYDLSQGVSSLSITASSLALNLAGLIEFHAENVTLDLDAELFATITSTTVRLPGITTLENIEIENIAFRRTGVTVGQATLLFDGQVIPFADILEIEGGTLTIEAFEFLFADPLKSSVVRASLTAVTTRLLPTGSSALGVVEDLIVEIEDGAITASATSATVNIDTALTFHSLDIEFNLAPNQPASAAVLTLKQFAVTSLDFADLLPETTGQNLAISRQGFSLAQLNLGGTDGHDATFDDFLSVEGLRIRVENLAYDRKTGFSGVIRVRANEANLFPILDGVTVRIYSEDPERFGLSGLYILTDEGWRLRVTASNLLLETGDLLKIRASDVQLNPHKNAFATIERAVIELPGIAAFEEAIIDGLVLRRDGMDLESATLSTAGTFNLENVLEVAGVELTIGGLNIAWNDPSSVLDGSLALSFSRAELFPRDNAPAVGTITGLFATIDQEGVIFWSGRVKLNLGDDLVVTGEGASYNFAATGDDPIISLATATVSSPTLGTFADGLSVSDINIFRDGLTIGNIARASTAAATVRLGTVVELVNPDFTIDNLGYRIGQGFTGELSFSTDTATLFPAGGLTASVTDTLSGELSLNAGTFTVSGGALAVTLAGFLEVRGERGTGGEPAFTFNFNPRAKANDILLTFTGLTASLDALVADGLAPSASLQGLTVTYGGRFFFNGSEGGSDVVISIQQGYANAVGVADLLPFTISEVSIDFDNRHDLQRVDGVFIGVSGRFTLDQFLDQLDFKPTIRIGGLDLTESTPFSFGLKVSSFRQGIIKPVGIGEITLGLDGLVLPGTTNEVSGSLRIGAIDSRGNISKVFGTDHQVVGELGISGLDVEGSFDLQGSILDTPTGKRITATGNLAVDVDGEGQPIQGGAAVGFEFLIESTRTTAAPYVDLDITAKITDLVIQNPTFPPNPVFELTVDRIEFTPGAPDGQFAKLSDAKLSFHQFPEWGTFTLASVAAFDDTSDGQIDGFAISGLTLDLPSRLKVGGTDILDLQGFKVTLNVAYRNGVLSGAVDLVGTSGTLFPNGIGGFSSSVKNLTGSIALDGKASLTAVEVTLELDGQVSLTGRNIAFNLDPEENAPIASMSNFEIRLPGLTELLGNAAVGGNSIAIYGDRIEVGAISLTVEGPFTLAGLFTASDIEVTVAAVTLSATQSAVGSVSVAIGSAALLPGQGNNGQGIATLTDMNASIVAGVLTWTAGVLTADVDGVFTVTASNVEFRYDTTPGTQERLYFSVTTAQASLNALAGVEFTANQFGFRLDGNNATSFFLDSVEVAEADAGTGILGSLGIADFLPLDLKKIRIEFEEPEAGQPTDFRTFTLEVDGRFDFSKFNLPFDVTLQIGSNSYDKDSTGTFSFSVMVDTLSGRLVPVDFGPIQLGISNLELGPVTLGGSVTLGGIANGVFVPSFAGQLSIAAGLDNIQGNATVTVGGHYDQVASLLHLTAGFQVGFQLGDFITVENASLQLNLAIKANTDFRLAVQSVSFSGAGIQLIDVDLGLVKARGSNVQLNFTNDRTIPLVMFKGTGDQGDGSATVIIDALEGWGGTLYNFAIGHDLTFYALPGFGASIQIPDARGSAFGLPEWLPLKVTEIGFQFNELLEEQDGVLTEKTKPAEFFSGLLNGAYTINDFTNVSILFSGGLDGTATELFPITAEAGRMKLNLRKLIDMPAKVDAGTFNFFNDSPIENISSIRLGIQPFQLGPVEIGGIIGFGQLPYSYTDDEGQTVSGTAFYGEIQGKFGYDGIGVGVQLIVTEYGPILSTITAGVPIPIGLLVGSVVPGVGNAVLSGFMITDLTGGFVFGGNRLPTVKDPVKDFLGNPQFSKPNQISTETIQAAVADAVKNDRYTWSQGFTMIVSGRLTNLKLGGFFSGDMLLGANIGFNDEGTSGTPVGFQLYGVGDVNIYGSPVGSAGILFDFKDLLEPSISFGFSVPGPGSHPLALLLPARAEFGGVYSTEGMNRALIVGAEAFLRKLAEGASWRAAEFFNGVMDDLAARLKSNPTRQLYRILLDTNGDGVISPAEHQRVMAPDFDFRPFMIERMLTLLPTDYEAMERNLKVASDVAGTLFNELVMLAFEKASTRPEGSENPFDLSDAAGNLLSTLQGGASLGNQAIVALAEVFRDAIFEAADKVDETINPSLVITGAMQPVIMGIPFGEPLTEVSLRVDKTGLGFGFQTSLNQMLGVFGPAGIAVGLLANMAGTSVDVGLEFKLPLGDNLVNILKGNALPNLTSLQNNFEAEVTGGISILGFKTGALSGRLVPPGQDEAYFEDKFWKVYDPNATPPSNDELGEIIPITRESHFQAISEYGGLVLTGQLFAPELLTDPQALIARLQEQNLTQLPDDFFQYLTWAQALADELSSTVEPARIQLFLPSAQNLLEQIGANLLNPQSPEERYDFNNPAILGPDGPLERYLSAAYFAGYWDSSFLSVPIGNARVEATIQGIEIEAQLPWLAGAKVNFVSVQNEDSTTLDQLFAMGLGLDLNEFLPSALPGSIRDQVLNLPVPGIPKTQGQASLDSNEVYALLESLGIDEFLEVKPTVTGSLLAYSPGFDLESELAIERNGGIEIQAQMSIDHLVEDASFAFRFVGSGTAIDATSEFSAKAHVKNLKIPGLDGRSNFIKIDGFDLEVIRNQQGLFIEVSGAMSLFGHGTDPGLRLELEEGSRLAVVNLPNGGQGLLGDLAFKAVSGEIAERFGLTIDGRMVLRIDTTGSTPQVGLWITGEDSGPATIELLDQVQLKGEFAFEFGPSGLMLALKGASFSLGARETPGSFLQFAAQGAFLLDANGVAGALALSQTSSISADLPISLNGTFGIRFNTTGRAIARIGTVNVNLPATRAVSVVMTGEAKIQNVFELSGSFRFEAAATEIGVHYQGKVDFLGQGMDSDGAFYILLGATRGIVANANLRLGTDTSPTLNFKPTLGFEVGGNFALKVNTTNTIQKGIASNLLEIAITQGNLWLYPSATAPQAQAFALTNGTFGLRWLGGTEQKFQLAFAGDINLLGRGYLANGSFKVTQGVGIDAIASLTRNGTTPDSDRPVELGEGSTITLKVNTLGSIWSAEVEAKDTTLHVLAGGQSVVDITQGNFFVKLNSAGVFNVKANGNINLPGIGKPIQADGDFPADGTFTLGILTDELPLGSSNSNLIFSGGFRLSRYLDEDSNQHIVRFQGDGVKLRWNLLPAKFNTFSIDNYFIESNGNIGLTIPGGTIAFFGDSAAATGILKLEMDNLYLHANPSLNEYELRVGTAKLHVPGIYEGANALTISVPHIQINGWPTITIERTLNFGFVRVQQGKLVLERLNNGVFQLAIQNNSANQSPVLDFPGLSRLGTFNLNTLFLQSNGNFEVDITTSRLGYLDQTTGQWSLPVSLGNGQFLVSKQGNDFKLVLKAKDLHVPLLPSMPLPNNFEFVIKSNNQAENPFKLTSLLKKHFSFGNAFKPYDNSWFQDQKMPEMELSFQNGAFFLQQKANTSFSIVSLTDTIGLSVSNLRIGLDTETFSPLFNADVKGLLQFPNLGGMTTDFRISYGVIDYRSQILRGLGGFSTSILVPVYGLKIETTKAAKLNLLFANIDAAGFFTSNGNYSFVATAEFPYLEVWGDFINDDKYENNYTVTVRITPSGMKVEGALNGSLTSDGIVTLSNGTRIPLTFHAAKNLISDPPESIKAIVDLFEQIWENVANVVQSTIDFYFNSKDGPIAGATVFLDVNRNGILDVIEIDGIEILEPWANSTADGTGALILPRLFDRNNNDMLDPDEGVLMAIGGFDTATRLPQTTPLWTLPNGNAGMISPLTTLHAELVSHLQLDYEEAWERIGLAFDLPLDNPGQYDAILGAFEGDEVAPPVFRAMAQTQNVLTQLTALIETYEQIPHGQAAFLSTQLLAEQLVESTLDLSSVIDLRAVLQRWADQSPVPMSADHLDGLAEVIAATNSRIQSLPMESTRAYLESVSRIQRVAQGRVTTAITQFVLGETTAESLLSEYTGTQLDAHISSASPGNVVAPRLEFTTSSEVIQPTGRELRVRVELSHASAVPIRAAVTIRLPSGALLHQPEGVYFEPGQTATEIVIPVATQFVNKGGLVRIALQTTDFVVGQFQHATRFNTPPTARNDGVVTARRAPIDIHVLNNDTDPNTSALTGQLVQLPRNGSVRWIAPGVLRYTPRPGFVGIDRLTYRARDGVSASNLATVTIHVRPGFLGVPIQRTIRKVAALRPFGTIQVADSANRGVVTTQIVISHPGLVNFTPTSLQAAGWQRVNSRVVQFVGTANQLQQSLRKLVAAPSATLRGYRGPVRVTFQIVSRFNNVITASQPYYITYV